MHVEVLDGRYAGKIRDIDDSVVADLIKQGRVRKLTGPTSAAPILPGGYRGTTNADSPEPTKKTKK